jgi:hypothetical protein
MTTRSKRLLVAIAVLIAIAAAIYALSGPMQSTLE